MPEAVRAYAYIVGITVVGIIVLFIMGVYVYDAHVSDGLSSAEIMGLIAIIGAAFNQVTLLFVGVQNRGIARETNGRNEARTRVTVNEESEAANRRQDERWERHE